MTDSGVGAELLKFVAQALTVVLGWVVVHRLSSDRDREKARKELLVKSTESLGEAIEKLLIASQAYHGNARDANAEIMIKMNLQDLSQRTVALSDLSQNALEHAACRSAVLALKRAITGYHFEDEHIQPVTGSDPILQRVAADALKAKQALLKLKHRQYSA